MTLTEPEVVESGKVVAIEICGFQPTEKVMQLALRPLVAFARGEITISGCRRDHRVGQRC